jgi:glycosyltransferase involved in cell wall biosynthesis
MLDEKTGIILQGTDEHELAEKAVYLLQHKDIRKQMGDYAFLKTRDTTWDKVAGNHVALFNKVLTKPVMKVESFTGLMN